MAITATSQLLQLAENYDAVMTDKHPQITDICIRSISEPQKAFDVRPNIFVRIYHYLKSKWSAPRSLDVGGKAVSVHLYDPTSNISGIQTLFRQALSDRRQATHTESPENLASIVRFALATDEMTGANDTEETCHNILLDAFQEASTPSELAEIFSCIDKEKRADFAVVASLKVAEFLENAITHKSPEEVFDAWQEIMVELGGDKSPVPYTMASFDNVIERLFTLWRERLPDDIDAIALEEVPNTFAQQNIPRQQTKCLDLLLQVPESVRNQLHIHLISNQARALGPLLFDLHEKMVTSAAQKIEKATPSEKQDLAICFSELKNNIAAIDTANDLFLSDKKQTLLSALQSSLDRLPAPSAHPVSASTQQRTADLGKRLFANYSNYLLNPANCLFAVSALGLGGIQLPVYAILLAAFSPFLMGAVDHIILQPLEKGLDKAIARIIPESYRGWTKTTLKAMGILAAIFLAPKIIDWWHTRKIVPITSLTHQAQEAGSSLSISKEVSQRITNAEARANAVVAKLEYTKAATGGSWLPWGRKG